MVVEVDEGQGGGGGRRGVMEDDDDDDDGKEGDEDEVVVGGRRRKRGGIRGDTEIEEEGMEEVEGEGVEELKEEERGKSGVTADADNLEELGRKKVDEEREGKLTLSSVKFLRGH